MSVITSDNIDFLKSLYSQMGNIAPKYKAFLITRKFNDETGIVRRSPSRDNPHHHTFYKCDNFKIENITKQTLTPLR